MTQDKAAPPLSGLRVLELARVLAGPWAGQVLADLGAEVIKVESPEGDDTRQWGPPFVENPDGSHDAAYFHATNRGKRSIAVDFRTEDGRRIVRDLAARSDVLIENFKVGGLRRHGLDYESLRAVNPRLIYCSISGFGQDGPYAHRPGYDFIIQGMGGIMDLTGAPDGEPQKSGVAFADIFTGLYAVVAIEAALIARERTGAGPASRPRPPRHPGRRPRQPGDELPRLGQGAATARQRPPQHRPLPVVPGEGRPRDHRRRQ